MNGKENEILEIFQEDSPLFDEISCKSIDGRFFEVRLIIDLKQLQRTLKFFDK